MNYYLDCWKKSFVFAGRARRSEFWLFALFNALAAILLLEVDGLIGTGGILYYLYVLASICANISVLVRRLHDTDRSGWWYWIVLVPLVGAVILFIFMVLDGTPGPNTFGKDPKRRRGVEMDEDEENETEGFVPGRDSLA